MSQILLVFIVSVGTFVANGNVIFFNGQSNALPRDHAQFCCSLYGMSLFKIESESQNSVFEGFLRSIPGVSAIWLGLFYNATLPTADDFYWTDGQQPTWSSWNSSELQTILNGTVNETVCIKGVLGAVSGLYWIPASCEEKHLYGCQAGLNKSDINVTVPSNAADACPKLQKLSGKNIVRNGTQALPSHPTVSSMTYGYFDIHDKIYAMGNQIGSYIVDTTVDCAIRCLGNTDCIEAIIVSKVLCILYKQ